MYQRLQQISKERRERQMEEERLNGFDHDDAGLTSLPVDPLSLYVFHDVAPRRFDGLRQQGRALEWRVYGPDGNFPFADSLLFTRSSLTPAGVDGVRLAAVAGERKGGG